MLVQPLPVEIEAHTQQLSCTHEYFKTCDFLVRGGGTLVIEHPVVGAGVVGAGVQSLTTKMINHNSEFFHQPIPLIILVGYHFSG